MLTDAVEKYTNIIFAGEPTGSKENAYGDLRKIILPNNGIMVRVSIYYWQDWHPLEKRDATVSQIPASLTFEADVIHCDRLARKCTQQHISEIIQWPR
jgi:hypothetical protein